MAAPNKSQGKRPEMTREDVAAHLFLSKQGDTPIAPNSIKYREGRHNATNNYPPRSEKRWSKTAILTQEAISARERDQDDSEG
jgi:hypothetical protein